MRIHALVKPIHFAYAVAALALFQVFFRYSYTTTTAGPVYRFDRLTQRACIIGPIDRCDATPTPIPAPTATPSLELEDQRAIAMVRSRSDAVSLESYELQAGNSSAYTWQVDARYTNDGKPENPFRALTVSNPSSRGTPDPSATLPSSFPVRIVWYARKLKDGSFSNSWPWEVHLDTHEVFPVIGNAALEAKYQVTTNPPKNTSK